MASVSTDSAQPSPPKTGPAQPGAIILARHGEPALARNVKLNAQEYREFWAEYELRGLLAGQTPPDSLVRLAAACGTLVASTRLRSIESAQALVGDRHFAREAVLIEAPLPPPNWPSWLRMSPKMWGFWARFWWWFFDHHEGQETRRQAEGRAAQAAEMLIDLASRGEEVVVLAHGFFNVMIGRELRRRGWKQAWSEGFKYWSMRRFERVDSRARRR